MNLLRHLAAWHPIVFAIVGWLVFFVPYMWVLSRLRNARRTHEKLEREWKHGGSRWD